MQKRRTYQQLQPEERMTIASMRQQGSSVRAMARTLGRSAATVSRELVRNTCPTVGYASAPAQARSTSRREAARPRAKLHVQSVAWRVVLTLLEWKWSPQQISGTLMRMLLRCANSASRCSNSANTGGGGVSLEPPDGTGLPTSIIVPCCLHAALATQVPSQEFRRVRRSIWQLGQSMSASSEVR